MTDKKISELTQTTGSDVDDANDKIAIVDVSTNTTKAITREELFKDIDGGITGTAVQQSADDTTDGRIARFNSPRGIMGLGGTRAIVSTDWDSITDAGFYTNGVTSSDLVGGPGSYTHMSLLNMRSGSGGSAAQIATRNVDTSTELYIRTSSTFPMPEDWEEIWHTGNTTVDGSGFLLEASPIVRVYEDSIVEPNKPVNATLTHSETGVYVLSGVPPLASEGWQVRSPNDLNGNKVVAIDPPDYDVDYRTLTLRTYDLLWQDGRLVPGDPMDVPGGHFVMLRFHEEPADRTN